MTSQKSMQSRYVTDARRYPLLSKETEEALVERMLKGDREAFNALVTGNLRLAMMIASQYKRSGVPVEDLVQAANIGLMRGVERFKPGQGAKLTYYVAFWIREQIRKVIMAEKSLLKIGTTQNQKKLFSNIHRKVEDICDFDKEQLALDLNVSVREIEEMCVRLRPEVRLDSSAFTDSNTARVIDGLKTAVQGPEEAVMEDDKSNVLVQLMQAANLADNELTIVMARNAEVPKTVAALATELSISDATVKVLYKKALAKLKGAADELGIRVDDIL